MYKTEVEVFANDSNHAILRHPDREFPGSLFQGDSLSILVAEIGEAIDLLESNNTEECKAVLHIIHNSLGSRLQRYETVLREHEIDLPYAKK